MKFQDNFIWGAASAAAQIEGAWDEDGRTPSIWDLMPEDAIDRGEDCHTACDHYHRWKEDIRLMKEIGLKAYRFSVSWSRVIPEKGKVNEKGLSFYRSLVDALVEAGIEPMITLYHSDLPQWVFDQGGWLTGETIEDFAFYAEVLTDALSDKVKYWFTMNEPQCMLADYQELSGGNPDVIYRHLLLAHGTAVSRMRVMAKQPLQIGFVIMGMTAEPAGDGLTEEQAAARTFTEHARYMGMVLWTDPVTKGVIPESVKDILSEDDMVTIYQPLDFFAANVYGSANYCDVPGRKNPLSYPGMPKSQIGMPIRPGCLYYTAKFAYERYRLPVLFTENGFSNIDFVMSDGRVHDPQRIDYISRYVKELERAVCEGIPVIGYLYWSIMDNFEWKKGYDMRFGLIYVDYQTQKRTLKDSAYFYRDLIAANGDITEENCFRRTYE